MLKKILNIFLLLLCFACSQKPAQILDRTHNHYNRPKEKKVEKISPRIIDSSAIGEKNLDEVPVKAVVVQQDIKEKPLQDAVGKEKTVTVLEGENLYSIAKKNQVSVYDLIKRNNLTAPYNVRSKTQLVIPALKYHEVKEGDTLYSVSRAYNMKIDEIIRLNQLQKPYILKKGEKIIIAGSVEQVAVVDSSGKTAAQNSVMAEKKVNYALPKEQKNEIVAAKPVVLKAEPRLAPSERASNKTNHFAWPLKGAIVSKFGPKSGGLYNDGINIKAKEGSNVQAAEDGVVAYVGNELKGYGNLVIVKHSGGWITAYAHLKGAKVARGQEVAKGEVVGIVGQSGNVKSPQLYFGLRKGRDAVNPQNYLK